MSTTCLILKSLPWLGGLQIYFSRKFLLLCGIFRCKDKLLLYLPPPTPSLVTFTFCKCKFCWTKKDNCFPVCSIVLVAPIVPHCYLCPLSLRLFLRLSLAHHFLCRHYLENVKTTLLHLPMKTIRSRVRLGEREWELRWGSSRRCAWGSDLSTRSGWVSLRTTCS